MNEMKSDLIFKNVSLAASARSILNNISFEVRNGESVALIGRNGAGKSTILRIGVGLFEPSHGEVIKPQTLKLGYLPEERGLYKNETVAQNVSFFHKLQTGSVLKKDDWAPMLTRVGFDESILSKKTKDLSKGQQQKVQWLLAVSHQPDLVVLDEPFSGYDPENAEWLIREINEMKLSGVSFLISSHRIDYMERLADKIICINKGSVVANGTFDEVFSTPCPNQFLLVFSEEVVFKQPIELIAMWKKTHFHYHVVVNDMDLGKAAILKLIQEKGASLVSFSPYMKSIQQVFQEIMPL